VVQRSKFASVFLEHGKSSIEENQSETGTSLYSLMVPGRREWDVQLVKAVLYPHDVQEVLKLRLSEMTPNDHVAWFYEKSGDLLYKECLSPGG
jgi:hypothetical protein